MKKIIQLLYILFAATAFSACSDGNQGEVVSQDLTYQLDANYVFVDIPKEFPFDPSNILYLEGKTMIKLNATNDGQQTTIAEGNSFSFNVRLKKALKQDVKVRLKKDPDLPKGHNLIEFPDEAFKLDEITIAAGSKEGRITLNITNPNMLNKIPGYVLPLRLDFVDAVSGVKISKQSYQVLIEMNLELRKDNIDPSNDQIAGESFNRGVVFESNKSSDLEYLYDGMTNNNYNYDYWSPKKDTFLTMTFSNSTKVLGVKIDFSTSQKLQSLNVYADEGDGFISYGKITRNNTNGTIYLKFKEPANIRALKFDGMLSTNSTYRYKEPRIYEITFIK